MAYGHASLDIAESCTGGQLGGFNPCGGYTGPAQSQQ